MRWRRHAALMLMVVVAPAFTGCQGSQTTAAPDMQAAGRQATPSAAPDADGEHLATSRYRIDITYPRLDHEEAPLTAMLHRIAGAAKQDFLRALPDPKIFPEFADRQLQLRIDFKIAARTGAFTSVRESGFQDTGGAHPAPIDAAIVYDTQAQRSIPLDDLFAQPDAARRALADFVRAAITEKMMAQAPKPGEGSPRAVNEWKASAKQIVEQGTQPTSQNFANYIVRASAQPGDPSPGLTLIFPPYQVAAYVYGTQVVDVPARVFATYLKPQYRSAFVIN
jgi:hypothetical protein